VISTRKISAIYSKNIKSVFSNPFIAALPFMMVGLAFVFHMITPEYAEYYETASTLIMLVLMNILIGGATIMAVLIAEEKEKNTLNVLITSTVSPLDFLISHVLTAATLTITVNVAMFYIIRIPDLPIADYMIITSIGAIAAITLGATLGLLAKNQAAASTMGTPLLAVVLLPSLITDNFIIDNILYYFFSEQINFAMMDLIMGGDVDFLRIGIMAANFVVFALIFAVCYRKRGLAT
jgi:ABC-2 type transport system permease protein